MGGDPLDLGEGERVDRDAAQVGAPGRARRLLNMGVLRGGASVRLEARKSAVEGVCEANLG